MSRPRIRASVPCLAPPEWALSERALFAPVSYTHLTLPTTPYV